MSGIAGIVRKDGSSVDAGTLETLTGTLDHRGPDGSGTAVSDTAGFGQQRLHTTPESKHEKTPRTGEEYLLTADVRIDNRAELLDTLDVRAKAEGEDGDTGVVTDADLVVAAYEEWGTRCPEYLVGAYAFALWDRQRERLFCARDHAGIKPLFYYDGDDAFVFGSEPKAVLAHDTVPRRLDETAVGDYLVGRREDTTRTFFATVERFPPANRAVLDERGLAVDRYWDLEPDDRLNDRLDSQSPDALVDGFRRRFEEAVRCRLRTAETGRAGTMLSGGLDSSSITCTAEEVRDDPLPTFSVTFDSVPESDEQESIDAVLESGQFEPHFLAGDEHSPLGVVDDVFEYVDAPFLAGNLYLDWELTRTASDADVRVLLGGHGGDTAVSFGYQRLPDLLREGNVRTLARELSAITSRTGYPLRRLLVDEVLSPVVPVPETASRLRAALDSTIRDQPTPSRRGCPCIQRSFADEIALDDRIRRLTEWGPPKDARDYHRRALRNTLDAPQTLEVSDTVAARVGVEPRYPFLDRRLLTYAVALPSALKLRRGWTRWALREAMDAIVPDAVRLRTDKGNLNHAFEETLRTTDRGLLDDLVDDAGSQRYVDVGRWRRSWKEFRDGGDVDGYSVVWRPAVLIYWLVNR